MNIAAEIKARQINWAEEQGIEFDQDNRCLRLEDNLCLRKINPETRREIKQGDGGELEKDGGRRPRMHSLYSSTALACNFFDYWRGVEDSSPLAEASKFHAKIHDIEFERKFDHKVSSRWPNLDLVLTDSNQTLLAIESKFTEPFSGSNNKNYLKQAYFSGGKKRWSELGLSGCQKLAKELGQEHCYEHLDAAQLLKHMLGLANCEKDWTLLYLWFNPGGPEAECHREEIEQFIDEVSRDGGKVGGGGVIRAMTYQDLFKSMSENLDGKHEAYRKYLEERYFPDR